MVVRSAVLNPARSLATQRCISYALLPGLPLLNTARIHPRAAIDLHFI